jgi:hypothetical protein
MWAAAFSAWKRRAQAARRLSERPSVELAMQRRIHAETRPLIFRRRFLQTIDHKHVDFRSLLDQF